MPVLARLLMLVACVPLLQPTGFCACKLGGAAPTPPRQNTAATPPKAGCCSHRHAPECDDDSAPRPAPADDRHLPGCPASVGVDHFKWAEPTEPVAAAPLPVESPAPYCLPVTTPAPARPVTSANWPSSPPIYLAHCTLVV